MGRLPRTAVNLERHYSGVLMFYRGNRKRAARVPQRVSVVSYTVYKYTPVLYSSDIILVLHLIVLIVQ